MSRHRDARATEVPLPNPRVLCARCGTPLIEIRSTENVAEHACDGDFEWLGDEEQAA
jgi:hypothetical protein